MLPTGHAASMKTESWQRSERAAAGWGAHSLWRGVVVLGGSLWGVARGLGVGLLWLRLLLLWLVVVGRL